MKLELLQTFMFFYFSIPLWGQNGWVPPVNFQSNTSICDTTSFKLVFYDEFNGDTLSSKWRTFNAYMGMQPKENEDWGGARVMSGMSGFNGFNWMCVALDKNVVVSNGTCKLKNFHEPHNWSCASCPPNATRYYTGAWIETPFFIGNTNNLDTNWFNSGLFEMRMKIANFATSHTTAWTWMSTPDGVNEIDMVEAYGPRDQVFRQDNTFNLHAFAPQSSSNNPYNITSDFGIGNKYPGFKWIYDKSISPQKNINDWHTYKCKWDTTNIEYYLDGMRIGTIYKYYIESHRTISKRFLGITLWSYNYIINIASGCNPFGTYKVNLGYPYNKNSNSHFRITLSPDGYQDTVQPVSTSNFLGQTEVDYVKIWQRHPAQDGHEVYCASAQNVPNPIISWASLFNLGLVLSILLR